MSKRVFILLIVLMSVALIGIITVQIYWINNTIEIREKQFTNDVRFALANVSENINKREVNDYYKEYGSIIDSATRSSTSRKTDLYFQRIDTVRKEIFSFRQSILENNYKSSIPLFGNDSLTFKTFFSEKSKEITNIKSFSKDYTETSPEERIYEIGKLSKLESVQFENYFRDIAANLPIYDRVSTNEITLNLDNELRERGVDTDFEFGVYGDGLATKVKSKKFKKQKGKSYQVPLFANDNGDSNYQLYVSFPEKNEYILASIANILALSAIFILIIILAFASALYQLLKQKQISEIKTDFINNMTHEFKTPISTIEVASDVLQQPNIVNEPARLLNYATIINKENKRLKNQVERVLQMASLENDAIKLNATKVAMHAIITGAVSQLEASLPEKTITLKLLAASDEILGDSLHLTNVIHNLLDNAIKYSPSPAIIVTTKNQNNKLLISVEDNGIGLTRDQIKYIFDKFYRVSTGNRHDVKGFGIGLSYVKLIILEHGGKVEVESTIGEGSTFVITLNNEN